MSGDDKEGESGGVQLSGGQKQRLMLAHARLRNPPILILGTKLFLVFTHILILFFVDEATSALDPPTCVLVLSALRRWRANKTTIMITHELEPQDFVYVFKGGSVVEQDFRGDLEAEAVMDEEGGKGEFRRRMASQVRDNCLGILPTNLTSSTHLHSHEPSPE